VREHCATVAAEREERDFMAYGGDVTVYVEDTAGDLGAPASPAPWWLSPDVDIPAHPGTAVQGTNQVQIRVHTHEEPIIQEKIVAEVYVGQPGFVLSPSVGTKRIDPATLLFRPPGVPGPEPVADVTGGTLTFPWTPSASAADVDGPGHRCLIVRAFPQSVAPPTTPFDVPNEGHEAQHNIEILVTTRKQGNANSPGAGTPRDPRKRDEKTGLWSERFGTMAVEKRGRSFVVWAFDPNPAKDIADTARLALKRVKFTGFSERPPAKLSLEPVGTEGTQIDVGDLLNDTSFIRHSGVGTGLFAKERLLGAATLALNPKELVHLLMGFDHSNVAAHTAVVLHGAQWSAAGRPEGGMTVVALAPV
jgi:hypothetical protein